MASEDRTVPRAQEVPTTETVGLTRGYEDRTGGVAGGNASERVFYVLADQSLEQVKTTVAAMHRDQREIEALKAETRTMLRKMRAA